MDDHFTNLYNYLYEENKMKDRSIIYYSGRTGLVRFLYKHEDLIIVTSLLLLSALPWFAAYYLLTQ